MAASFRRGSSPESRPISRHHERPKLDTNRRRDSHTRRHHSERHRDQLIRRSPPRPAQQWSPYQLPTPMSTPSTSTGCLNLQVEHTRGLPMERTPSGNLIISDNTYEPRYNHTLPTTSDEDAAHWVQNHFRNVQSQAETEEERSLRRLIDSNAAIDEGGLRSIPNAVNNIFFNGALSGRVKWEWSHQSDERYKTELVATTALREATDQSGYETLIVLSKPILTDPSYDRRLILSAFIHELIHCYLFILCGFNARIQGGHTEGFHTIAKIIDEWAGFNKLRLCNMKANLNHFRLDRSRMRYERHGNEGCTDRFRSESEEGVSMGTLERFH